MAIKASSLGGAICNQVWPLSREQKSGLAQLGASFWCQIMRAHTWYHQRRAIQYLQALPAYRLKDIGLERSEISARVSGQPRR